MKIVLMKDVQFGCLEIFLREIVNSLIIKDDALHLVVSHKM